MPQLLLLLALRVSVEDLEQVAALSDLSVGVGVDDLGQVLHEAEVGPHLVCEACDLAELWDQSDLCTSPSVLVDKERLVRLANFLIVASLVVLLVRHLFKDIRHASN